jgi:kynurenine formamidase
VDAPLHFLAGGRSVDELPLEKLVGPARLIDLASGGQLEAGARLGVEALAPFAEFIRPGARLLCRTGWDRRFGGPGFYDGYPSIDPTAARLLAERGIWLLGLDTPSPSVEPEEVHRILLGAGVVILEALTGLERLPDEFLLAALPLKLRGGDGSPARAVAILDV